MFFLHKKCFFWYVCSFADNAVAATRVINNTIFANLDSINTSVQHTKDTVKELSKIGANTVKTFQQVTILANKNSHIKSLY